MSNRPLMFLAAPLLAVPVVVVFLFVGGASEPPAGSTVGETMSQLEPRTPSCGSRVDACPNGVVLGMRPLAC